MYSVRNDHLQRGAPEVMRTVHPDLLPLFWDEPIEKIKKQRETFKYVTIYMINEDTLSNLAEMGY